MYVAGVATCYEYVVLCCDYSQFILRIFPEYHLLSYSHKIQSFLKYTLSTYMRLLNLCDNVNSQDKDR